MTIDKKISGSVMARAASMVIRCAALAGIACGLAAAAPAGEKAPARKLSAEQIVAKNVAARGGLEAWRKIQTMVWIGHIESAHAPVPSMPFMFEQERPNKTHFEINAMGDRALRVFDGKQGWKLRPTHGRPDVSPYSLEEIRYEQSGPGIDGVLIDYAAKGSSVVVAGIDEVEKRPAYHLIVRTASGETQHLWVDTRTFLEIRYDRSVPAGEGASRTVSVVYRDYKTIEGLKIPSIIETGVGTGGTPDRMVIERIVLNPRLDARAFSPPGTPRGSPRAFQDRGPFPPHRPSGAQSPPAWLSPATPAGSPAPSPGAAPAPAPGSPPQPEPRSDSPSASSQDPGPRPQ